MFAVSGLAADLPEKEFVCQREGDGWPGGDGAAGDGGLGRSDVGGDAGGRSDEERTPGEESSGFARAAAGEQGHGRGNHHAVDAEGEEPRSPALACFERERSHVFVATCP
jgi:hypothetical protein